MWIRNGEYARSGELVVPAFVFAAGCVSCGFAILWVLRHRSYGLVRVIFDGAENAVILEEDVGGQIETSNISLMFVKGLVGSREYYGGGRSSAAHWDYGIGLAFNDGGILTLMIESDQSNPSALEEVGRIYADWSARIEFIGENASSKEVGTPPSDRLIDVQQAGTWEVGWMDRSGGLGALLAGAAWTLIPYAAYLACRAPEISWLARAPVYLFGGAFFLVGMSELVGGVMAMFLPGYVHVNSEGLQYRAPTQLRQRRIPKDKIEAVCLEQTLDDFAPSLHALDQEEMHQRLSIPEAFGRDQSSGDIVWSLINAPIVDRPGLTMRDYIALDRAIGDAILRLSGKSVA